MTNNIKRYFSILRQAELRHIVHPADSLRKIKRILLSKPRNRFLVKIFRNVYRFEEPKKWVFIVGCYNSGTTLLEKILAEHPDVCALDEGVFLTDQLRAPEEFGWTRMWIKTLDRIRLDKDDDSVDIEKLKQDWGIFLDSSKDVYLEKSISNSTRMLWLQEHFENAYFIFIVRNGYAVSEGIRRKAGKGRNPILERFGESYPIELCARQWVEGNKVIEEDSSEVNRFYRLKYEDLCERPVETVQKILDFLRLEKCLLFNPDRQWHIQEKREPIRNMNKRSISELSSEDIEKVNEVAQETLEFYDYKIVGGKKNRDFGGE